MITLQTKLKFLFISIVLAIIFSGIYAVDLNKQIIAKSTDAYLFISFIDTVKDNLSNFRDPLASTDDFRYPIGINFRFNNDGMFAIALGVFYSFFVDYIVAYNWIVFSIFVANIYLSWYFFTKISKLYEVDDFSGLKALLSCILFALSPYFFSRITGHLNLAFIGGLPFFAYAVLVFQKKLHHNENLVIKDFIRFFAAVFLVAIGSLQYLIILAYVVAAFVIYLSMFQRKLLHHIYESLLNNVTNKFGEFFAYFVVFMLIFLYLYGGFVFGYIAGKLAVFKNFSYDIQLLDFVLPNTYLEGELTKYNPSSPNNEKVIALGIVSLFFLLYFLVRSKKRELGILLASFTGFYVLLSTAMLQLPAYYEGVRVAIIIQLLVSIYILLVPSFLTKRSVLFFILISIALIPGYTKIPFTLKPDFKMLEVVSTAPGDVVLVLPVSIVDFERNNIVSLAGKKLIDGGLNQAASTPIANSFLREHLAQTMCMTDFNELVNPEEIYARAVEDVRNLGVKTVVIEHEIIDRVEDNSSCKHFAQFFVENFSDMTEVYFADAEYTIYVFK